MSSSGAIYETNKFYVRPFTADDITDEYKSWFIDPDVTKFNSHGLFPYTKNQMQSFLASLESPNNLVWAIIAKVQTLSKFYEIHIGNISLQNINWINRSAEFAVVIGNKDHWGKGYCTEAAELIFEHGFSKLNLHRIRTGTAETNKGMMKVAMKLGMKLEGVFRDGVYLDGEYVNVMALGILRHEWTARK